MHFSVSNLQTDASHFHVVYLLRIWRVKALMPTLRELNATSLFSFLLRLLICNKGPKSSTPQDITEIALQARRRNISSKNCMWTQVTEVCELASRPVLLSPPGRGLPWRSYYSWTCGEFWRLLPAMLQRWNPHWGGPYTRLKFTPGANSPVWN